MFNVKYLLRIQGEGTSELNASVVEGPQTHPCPCPCFSLWNSDACFLLAS